jgi:uncharacterized protein YkwD
MTRRYPERRTATAAQSNRTLGIIAVAIVTAAAVVLPAQAAQAAPTTLRSTERSPTGATVGMSAKDGSSLSPARYEARLQVWANRVRHRHDVPRITTRRCDDGFAERWTGYLTRNREFRHQNLGPYMHRCGLAKAGEILASGPVTPFRMIQMWMHSPDHRRLLLERSYPRAGIAARRCHNGIWIGCVDFGRR